MHVLHFVCDLVFSDTSTKEKCYKLENLTQFQKSLKLVFKNWVWCFFIKWTWFHKLYKYSTIDNNFHKKRIYNLNSSNLLADDLTNPTPVTTFAHLDANYFNIKRFSHQRYLSRCRSFRLNFCHVSTLDYRQKTLQNSIRS